MRQRNLSILVWASALVISSLSLSTRAAITVDGTINESDYGSSVPGASALATQTINSSFGSNQLDAAYGVVENGFLYLGFTGNFQNNGNVLQVFIADGRSGGQNTLSGVPSTAGNLNKANGSVFSPGFNATYALELNASGSSFFVDQFNLIPNTASFLGSFALTGGVGNSQNVGGLEVGYNNTNAAGITMGDATGSAADQTAAQAVGTGIELGIPLSTLGNPTGNILVMADINGSGDSGASNQFLPGLEVGTPSVKKGPQSATNPYWLLGQGGTVSTNNGTGFTFANFPNEYFTVPNTVLSNGIWLPTGSGSWGTPSNWTNNYVPGVAGDAASFSSATGGATVTLDGDRTVGSISFNDANAYDIDSGSGGTLIMDNGANQATITDAGGTHQITAPVQLNSTLLVTAPNHGDSVYLTNNITGPGGLITAASSNSAGQSTFTAGVFLGGVNTYQGPTIIQAGTLILQSSTALPVGTALTLDAPSPHGVLDLNGNNATVSSITDTGIGVQIINNGGGSSTFTYAGSNSNPSTFDGNITDTSQFGGGMISITVSGGLLTLTGSNSYYGTTTINSGASLTYSGTTGVSMQGTGDIINNGSLTINDVLNLSSGNNISGAGTTTINAAMSLLANDFTQGALINNGTLTIQGNGSVGNISGAGTLNIGSQLQITPGSGESQQAAVNISGTLDITNNALVIAFAPNSDPISTIVGYIKSAYDQGKWDGSGLTSSTAASTPGTAVGYADGNTDTGTAAAAGTDLVRFTWLGDLNLDGIVNNADLLIMKVNAGMSGADWAEGDVNYDGVVNADDFALLQLGVAESHGQTLAVPEPASLALLALPLLARRRRSV